MHEHDVNSEQGWERTTKERRKKNKKNRNHDTSGNPNPPQESYPFLGLRSGLSVRRLPRPFSYTIRYGQRMGVLAHPYYPLQ